MFNIITQRLLWKEFRAQQLVWIAIAGELVLLQLWWGIKGHEYADLNLFSMAFVFTGVFAMTTCALLFAGESEAKTDLFLRQLPITPRQLIGGKLLYGGLALVAFLVFAILSTLIAGQMAGKYGGDSSSLMGDPSVFALSIVGLGAWGLFYSLLTRKVLWTVIGAALTEILIGGIVHSILAGYHLPDSVFYSIYTVIVLGVLAVDAKLLLRWCAGEVADQQTNSGSRLDDQMLLRWPTSTAVNATAPVATIALLRQTTFRSSWITGVVTTLYGLLLIILLRISDGRESITAGESLLLMFGGATILAIITVFAISGVRQRSAPGGTNFAQQLFDLPLTLRSCGSLLGMAGLAVGGFVLGIVASYTILAIPVGMMFINHGVGRSPMWTEMLWFLLMAIGSSFTLWVGTQWLKTGQFLGTGTWLPLLQQSHSIRSRTVQRIRPLLWIEARRALPVLLGGWAVLTLIGWYRPEMRDYGALSYFAIVIAALVCGLLTLLPDRSHGTLAFLTERGVSSTKIMLSKVFVWGLTLLLMLIPPLLQGRVWEMLDIPTLTPQIAHGLYAAQGIPVINMVSAPSPARYLFVLFLGTFTIGVLAAAWVRRPILAGIVGFSLMLPWFGWVTMLMGTYAPIGLTAVVPIVLIGLGILWTGSRTLLEQSSWRSKFGQIGWVLLVGFVGLQGYFHFRANEIPYLYDELAEIRNGQPSPLGNPPSSWKYPYDQSVHHASHLDSLVDDEAKRNSLVQPPGLWGAPHAFQVGIESLNLDDESCDLDAAFEHLQKWQQLAEQLATASRDEDGWIDALYGHRVVFSAIRQWANHPKQTAERLEAALEKSPLKFSTSGGTVIARQYADTRRALETGISTDNIFRPGIAHTSPVARWLLARTGEKERVRRLIDYYFYLSAGSQVSQPSTAGSEFDHWIGTTHTSAATLGVTLPWQRLNFRHRGQFELALTSETATRLILQLQAWRLKHGSFPASFAEVITEAGPINTHDFLTNAPFHYEPQGFDRDLQAETNILISARQPLLYSEGLNEPRGVELTQLDPVGNPHLDPMSDLVPTYQYRARDYNLHGVRSRQDQPSATRPVNPNTIRYSVLGQVIDEDSLWQMPQERSTEGEIP